MFDEAICWITESVSNKTTWLVLMVEILASSGCVALSFDLIHVLSRPACTRSTNPTHIQIIDYQWIREFRRIRSLSSCSLRQSIVLFVAPRCSIRWSDSHLVWENAAISPRSRVFLYINYVIVCLTMHSPYERVNVCPAWWTIVSIAIAHNI